MSGLSQSYRQPQSNPDGEYVVPKQEFPNVICLHWSLLFNRKKARFLAFIPALANTKDLSGLPVASVGVAHFSSEKGPEANTTMF